MTRTFSDRHPKVLPACNFLSQYYFYNIFLQKSCRFSLHSYLTKFEAAKTGSGVGFCVWPLCGAKLNLVPRGRDLFGQRRDRRMSKGPLGTRLGPNYTTAAHAFVKATLRLGLRAPFVARNQRVTMIANLYLITLRFKIISEILVRSLATFYCQ